MIDDGYAAVTSRRVAKDAGVTPALVHYYFGTIEDLFIAVLRRRASQQIERLQRLLASPQPVRAVWTAAADPAGTALLMEFMALSNHRKAIRAELAADAEHWRKAQLDALTTHIEASGLNASEFPAVTVLVAIAGLSRTVVMEEALGMTTGLKETRALVERLLTRIEGPPPPRPRKRPARKPQPSA